MRTLHYTMMGVMMVAVLAVAVGAAQPWHHAALAQHGGAQHGEAQHGEVEHGHGQHAQADDPQAHFDHVAALLALTDAQRETLTEPFHAAFAAMQELHRLHDVIAAELTEEQQGKLAQLVHEMLGGPMAAQSHSDARHGDGSY